jgi:hypothetical protein
MHTSDISIITRGIHADLLDIKREFNIVIPTPDKLIDYLQKNPELVDILWKVSKLTSDSFPKPNEVAIEMSSGEEPSDNILVVFVRMKEYPEDIINQLDFICEKFESDLILSEGFILLTTDFQSPKYSNDLPMV